MRPKFHASLMTMQQIKAEVTRRGWTHFRVKVNDGKLYVYKLWWWDVPTLPRLRVVK